MGRMTGKQLIARDAKRDLGAELLRAVREMKAGKGVRVGVKVTCRLSTAQPILRKWPVRDQLLIDSV